MSQGRIEPTGSATPASPAPADTSDASVEEIEADITATRERLAESVDALADKVNVKARAQEKAAETKQQAKKKLGHAKTKGQDLLSQAGEAPRPIQLAIVAVPVALIILLIVKTVRGRRS